MADPDPDVIAQAVEDVAQYGQSTTTAGHTLNRASLRDLWEISQKAAAKAARTRGRARAVVRFKGPGV